MRRSAVRPILLLLIGLTFAACSGTAPHLPPPTPVAGETPPMPVPMREFRGAWIATVDNIDWPSEPGLPVAQQKAEMRALLDRAALLNLNAVVFQIRPTADAFYDDGLEPWSAYLTGQQGQPPAPHYDPLTFAIEEAHRRGLELHAWFNPYRAKHPTAAGSLAETHISNTHPEIVKAYGDLLWLDPGEQAALDHTVAVVLDVVRRYDVDGIHFDDYFYPYPINDADGNEVTFPDSSSWARYQASGGPLSRNDWRRQNVDRMVERLHREIKAVKPWVKFGISPFGIWRPGYPEQIRGFDAYDRLYADARKWQQEGWVDYFAPQLYWPIAQTAQSYPVLLEWWVAQNTAGRHLWPGNFTSRVGMEGTRGWAPQELHDQIAATRTEPGATGNIHFSMKALMPDYSDLGTQLAAGAYRRPALVPASPWLDPQRPAAPSVAVEALGPEAVATMHPALGETTWLWVVRARYGARWTLAVVPGWQQHHRLGDAMPDEVVVSAVSRVGVEGTIARWRRPAAAAAP